MTLEAIFLNFEFKEECFFVNEGLQGYLRSGQKRVTLAMFWPKKRKPAAKKGQGMAIAKRLRGLLPHSWLER